MSYIKYKYREHKETKELTQLYKLIKAEENFKKSNLVSKELQKKHRILCYIFDILQDNLEDAIKLYCL